MRVINLDGPKNHGDLAADRLEPRNLFIIAARAAGEHLCNLSLPLLGRLWLRPRSTSLGMMEDE